MLPQVDWSLVAGQIDQETCPSPTSGSCWNPRAELKTSRERGVGLGQATIAFRSDGSVRFDKIAELRERFADLKDWQGERIYDPRLQLRALVHLDRDCYEVASFAVDGLNRAAMMFNCYNGGKVGLLQDRQLCRQVQGCNPAIWFGNIEGHSLKARTRVAGYGKSFFDISREYPRNVMFVRAPKYRGRG